MHCYFLCVCQGSSVDRHSNNASLFSLVEQVNLPETTLTERRMLPLEVHSYFFVSEEWIDRRFEMRFALVAPGGLETFSDGFKHRSKSERLRVRTLGLPQPPLFGDYRLYVETRLDEATEWLRHPAAWPLRWAPTSPKPAVTH